MGIFARLFRKKEEPPVPPIPPWAEIVETMYGRELDSLGGEVAAVLYSTDRTKRFVVLKSEKGFFKYEYEELTPFDEEEWRYVSRRPGALPAMWLPPISRQGISIYESFEAAMREIRAEPIYRAFFPDE